MRPVHRHLRPAPARLLVVLLAAMPVLAGCGDPEPPPTVRGDPTTQPGVATPRPEVDPSAAADAATFGPWRRRPVAPSAQIAAAAENACRSQDPVGDRPLLLTDNRGEAVLTLVFVDDATAVVCHVAVARDGRTTADARAIPEVAGAPAPGDGALGAYDLDVIEASSGARVVIVGRVADVPEVSVSFDDATWARMSMNAGWYTAWWPQAALPLSVATVDRRNVVISSFPIE